MLNSFNETIDHLAFLFAHAGLKSHNGGSIYAAAAEIVGGDRSGEAFDSHVNYPYITARERYVSNVSSEVLAGAPGREKVAEHLKKLLDGVPFLFVFDIHNRLGEIKSFSGKQRIIDLAFAAEFFLPQLDSHSPKRVWEHLHGKPRRKISVSAKEGVRLSIDLVDHICGTLLNDQLHPRAAAIRYYLKASKTLFGDAFLHIARNYKRYFGGLFDPCTVSDTDDWRPFLEKARSTRLKDREEPTSESISTAHLTSLFEAMSNAGGGFKFRSEQVGYAESVAGALNDKAVLTIEAGTGTGKTQGYLIPVMEYLYRNKAARAVISTYTKNLQEQIVQREITRTHAVFKMYRHIPVALLKGKSSYVCAEKLDQLYEEGWRGARLLVWLYFVNVAYLFRDVDIDGFGEKIRTFLGNGGKMGQMVNEISAKSGCTLRHHNCPAQVVTADAYFSRLVVTNHHKLALLDQDTVLAGLFNNYVIDEANHLESAVRSALAVELRSAEMSGTLDYLQGTATRLMKRAAGDLTRKLTLAQSEISDLGRMRLDFRHCLGAVNPKAGPGDLLILPGEHPAFPDRRTKNILIGMGRILAAIRHLFSDLSDSEALRMLKITDRTAKRIRTALVRLAEFEESLKTIEHSLASQEHVTAYRCFQKHWALTALPVDVAEMIRENFFDTKDAIVFTAATITNKGSFDRFKSINGMDPSVRQGGDIGQSRAFLFRKIPSPFPEDTMEIIVPREAVSGKYDNKKQWLSAVTAAIPKRVAKNAGRTLVLFSSYSDLAAVASQVAETINGMNLPLLIQQKGFSTVNLCEEFRSVKESVLFGVDTFWYGVDFRGDTLTQVIITRIPYPSPFDPIQRARKNILSPREYWRRYTYEADIKLRQGIGRLIRSETDRGRVVILDSRFKMDKIGNH